MATPFPSSVPSITSPWRASSIVLNFSSIFRCSRSWLVNTASAFTDVNPSLNSSIRASHAMTVAASSVACKRSNRSHRAPASSSWAATETPTLPRRIGCAGMIPPSRLARWARRNGKPLPSTSSLCSWRKIGRDHRSAAQNMGSKDEGL